MDLDEEVTSTSSASMKDYYATFDDNLAYADDEPYDIFPFCRWGPLEQPPEEEPFRKILVRNAPNELIVGREPSDAARFAAEKFLESSWQNQDIVKKLVSQPPEVFASILLANIPDELSMNRLASNQVLQGLEFVRDGIKRRSRKRNLYFCSGYIQLPPDVFIHGVLSYLNKRDLLDSVCYVSSAWAKACFSPYVERWQCINLEYSSGRIVNEDLLMKMLARYQFSFLKVLHGGTVLERAMANDSTIEMIARVRPMLESLGSYTFSKHMLPNIAVLFPRLKVLNTFICDSCPLIMSSISAGGLGSNLQCLHLVDEDVLTTPFTDNDFVQIANMCPNLEDFRFLVASEESHQAYPLLINGPFGSSYKNGIRALIDGCPKLKNLVLEGGSPRLTEIVCRHIASHARNLKLLSVKGCFTYKFGDGVLVDKKMDDVLRDCLSWRLKDIDEFEFGFDSPFTFSLNPFPYEI